MGGVQPRLRPRPIDKNRLVSGINGRKWAIFAVVPIDSWDEFYALYCQNKWFTFYFITCYGQHHVIVMDKSSKHYNLKIQNFSNEILRDRG